MFDVDRELQWFLVVDSELGAGQVDYSLTFCVSFLVVQAE